jgi:hypothetical protein
MMRWGVAKIKNNREIEMIWGVAKRRRPKRNGKRLDK